MSTDEVGRYWIDRRIRGQSGPPKSVPSVDLLRRLAAKLEGAVIYIAVEDITPELKLIRIDGKFPRQPGYRLEY
jgi:hypothetical protein